MEPANKGESKEERKEGVSEGKMSNEIRCRRVSQRKRRNEAENTPSVVPDLQGTSSVHVSSELGDGGRALIGGGELDDSLTSGSSGVEVDKDLSGDDLSGSLEELDEILVGGRPRKLKEEGKDDGERASVRGRYEKSDDGRGGAVETHVVDQDLLGRVVGSSSTSVSEGVSSSN